MQTTPILTRFRRFLATRKIARIAAGDGGTKKISRIYIYAFCRPKGYRRCRLGDRQFVVIARMIRVKAADVRQDYVARGGIVAKQRSRRVA